MKRLEGSRLEELCRTHMTIYIHRDLCQEWELLTMVCEVREDIRWDSHLSIDTLLCDIDTTVAVEGLPELFQDLNESVWLRDGLESVEGNHGIGGGLERVSRGGSGSIDEKAEGVRVWCSGEL
jgi:hypothetical protein